MAMRLGKRPRQTDAKTLQLDPLMDTALALTPPTQYDFNKGRSRFPTHMWGNDEYGNCVDAGQANQLLRLERLELHRNVALTDADCIARYKDQTGCRSPGDNNDTGLVMLYALQDWRNKGWKHGTKNYKIDAYGLVSHDKHDLLRAAIFFLNGVQFGLALPSSAQREFSDKEWSSTSDPPGSWGGHAVYCDGYDAGGYFIWTWATRIYMTNAFVDRYCDEAWAVVDALDNHSRWLDVEKLREYLGTLSNKIDG